MEYLKKGEGITLITLIITIIILIILTAITLNNVTESNLFDLATSAVKDYTASSEREKLAFFLLEMRANNDNTDGDTAYRVGEKLIDKKVGNSDWNVVVTNDRNYGTNWYFVEKGKQLQDFGTLTKDWLINYNTGEIVELEEGKYTKLSANESLAITDNLIFNLDSSVIDKGIKNEEKEIQQYLEKGVELHNFNFNEKSGLTNTSFNFDGENDYITLNLDDTKKFDTGLTLEFYGRLLGKAKLVYDNNGQDYTDPNGNTMNSFFEIASKNNRFSESKLRFSMDVIENGIKQIGWGLGYFRTHKIPDGFRGDFKDKMPDGRDFWDRFLFSDYDLNWNFNEDKYITVTIDGEKETVFINGELKGSGKFDSEDNYWKDFTNLLNGGDTIFIGSCSLTDNVVGYLKANAYTFRLYSKALSVDEVQKNYEKSVSYHKLLVADK